MPRRRGFINAEEVLKKLEVGRAGAIQVCTQAKIGSAEYRSANHITEAIDDLAEKLTGDRTYFHGKPATTAPREQQ
ncbi:hypothetical protein Q669_29595 [Labrenzia sp. C1B10]|nr:hypothetical protein Q669_29595 [Labrenzia sp. C1B10]ERS05791.1 hypothetical protein Q675_29160 [Labrenzia sp. C1B70]